MKLIVQFDIDADIINVPEFIIEQKEKFKDLFLDWIYNENVNHNYWVEFTDSNGNMQRGLQYRSDAFVKWLNDNIIENMSDKASIVAECVSEWSDDAPVLQF